jgi:hypothetical protein
VHDDVEALVAEVGLEAIGDALDADVAELAVALVVARLLGHVGVDVEVGVEAVDLLERELAAVRHLHGLVELAALEQGLEDAQRRRPRAQAHRRTRLGQRLGDGPSEASVVGHAGDERALAREVDR